MLETTRLSGESEGIELDIVERVATPKRVMKLGIQLHLSGLSLSNTVSVLESLGIDRARSTVHNWIQKADLEPRSGRDPDKIALDGTVVKVNGEWFWLYAAVDPETNVILHTSIYPSRTIVLTKIFLRELRGKRMIDDAEFFVDGAPWLQAGLFELGMHFGTKRTGIETRLNVYFKR